MIGSDPGDLFRHLSPETLRRVAADLCRAPQTPEVADLTRQVGEWHEAKARAYRRAARAGGGCGIASPT